jgi:predicted Zn-dependent protease
MTDSRHDEQLARLLRETRLPEATVDPTLLAQLRAQTSQIVASVGVTPSSKTYRTRSFWRQPMVRYGLALTTTMLLVLGLAFLSWLQPSSLNLVASVESLEKLDSFVATQKLPMGMQEIRYQKAGGLRIDHGASYTLHHEGQSWDVNEAENRATRIGSSMLTNGRINLRQLLRLPAEADLSSEPVEMTSPKPGIEERLYFLGRSTLQLRWQINIKNRQTVAFKFTDQGQQPERVEELVITSTNAGQPRELFQLKDTLTEDGRIGVVQDVQGLVMVRPVGRERWTPLAAGDLLKPGDLVRANLRGAHAARLRLTPNTDVTFGPGAILELKSPTELRVQNGDVEVHPRQRKITVTGGAAPRIIDDKTILRGEAEKLITLFDAPAWLKGFQGTVVNESLGQLLAKVDDRNVPLNVGYHSVNVEIRDGLARTTVEESFINTTNTELEGTFYFPLPSDASIAGFGMWIGNELVEADIVEKQRAREIFDIILSEKKDPALLEWAGGNLFKTRVYPIPAHGEKRVKITYTQALPLEGNKYRYSYALLSDLLKAHPLKKLDINVTVSSELPLAKVHSPTHPMREELTGTAARLVFSSQEHTPTRDFEAVIELAATPNAITVLPHRRGDDGYFLMRIMPPQDLTGWSRTLVRDGQPLHVLLLCDTSASIDKNQRAQQRAFAEALLSSLTARDTFNLGVFDVDTEWAFQQQELADATKIDAAIAKLQSRRSMGWSDFEKALASAQQNAALVPGTVILYLGDGIPAMSWGHDPKVLVDKLKAIVSRDKAPVHAVALGATHEPQTLRALANMSGGSWRKIAAERGSALQARDLLSELTDPHLLHDLKVSFTGIQTAKIYPETLPNVQAGTGLVLTGRYLPGAAQQGNVRITALRGKTPVRYEAAVTLPAADAGNSFIPRLWARQHIEALLESGGSANRDEIIARSEEFHLMTPYTSMLVLENDSMREHFAVKKRFNMRDGERFFADGKSQSELLLRQKQMQAARDWRMNLQRRTLAQLAGLGRVNPYTPQSRRRWDEGNDRYYFASGRLRGAVEFDPIGSRVDSLALGLQDDWGETTITGTMELRERVLAENVVRGTGGYALDDISASANFLGDKRDDYIRLADSGKDLGEVQLGQSLEWYSESDRKKSEHSDGPISISRNYDAVHFGNEIRTIVSPEQGVLLNEPLAGEYASYSRMYDDEVFHHRLAAAQVSMGRGMGGGRYQSYRQPPVNLAQLFPQLPPKTLLTKPVAANPPVWSYEIVEIVKSLDQRATLRQQNATLKLERTVETFDVRRGALSHRSERSEHLGPTGWHTQTTSDQSATLVEWCTPTERVVLHLAYHTGRSRVSVATDRELIPIQWEDHSLADLVSAYGQLPAKLEKLAGSVVRLTFQYPHDLTVIWHIDTGRKVLLKVEHMTAGKVNSTEVLSEFQQVAGRWWATKRTVCDGQGRVLSQSKQRVSAEPAATLEVQWAEAKMLASQCLVLTSPLPTLTEAKAACSPGGKGSPLAHFVLLQHYAMSQQWANVQEHLVALEKQPQLRSSVKLLRLLMLHASRQHAKLQQEVYAQVKTLTEQPLPRLNDDWYRYIFVSTQLSSVASASEMLRFLEAQTVVYQRQPAHLRAPREMQKGLGYQLGNLGRRDEALALWKALATSDIHDTVVQWQYFSQLLQINDYDAAHRHFFMLLDPSREVFTSDDENQQYWQQLFMKLHEMGRYPEMFALASIWIKRQPTQQLGYQAYLLALVLTDQEAEYHRTQLQWITTGPDVKEGTARDRQFNAALANALNQTYFGFEHQWRQQGVDERLHVPLLAFVKAHLTSARLQSHIQQILSSAVGHIAAGMDLRESLPALFNELAATGTLAELRSLNQLNDYAVARNPAMQQIHQAQYKVAAEKLKSRWAALIGAKEKHDMGEFTLHVISRRMDSVTFIAFQEQRLREEAPQYHLGIKGALYAHLLQQEKTEANEAAILALFPQLDAPELSKHQTAVAQLQRFEHLVQLFFQSREQKAHAAIKDKEKLDRVKQQEAQAAATKQAHRELVARLTRPDFTRLELIAPWLAVETIYHRHKSGEEPTAIAAATWTAYDAVPKTKSKLTYATITTHDELEQVQLEGMYQQLSARHLTVLTYLATLPKAKQPEASVKLKTHLAAKLKAEPTSPFWRGAWSRLLIALDQPKELEAALREWIADAGADQQYCLQLAYLQAERGRLKEAIDLIEKVKAEDELTPGDYAALNNWLLAVDEKSRHRQAQAQQFAASSEQALYSALQRTQALVTMPGQNAQPPLPEETFLIIPELLRKSASPSHYFSIIQTLYEATKDFRLLAGLADGTTGHTPGQVYEMLTQWYRFIHTLQEEATLDELSKRLLELRQAATVDSDRRAFDLLLAFLHRKASTQINQPGEHAKLAVECLQRAMTHTWQREEPAAMAALLTQLRTEDHAAWKEQLTATFNKLMKLTPAGSPERCSVAYHYAQSHPQPFEFLQQQITEVQRAYPDGLLPEYSRFIVNQYLSMSQSREKTTEDFVQKELQKPGYAATSREWLTDQLHALFFRAYQTGGTVSLGSGATLYRALETLHLQLATTATSQLRRYHHVMQLPPLYHEAKLQNHATMAADCKAMMLQKLLPILKNQVYQRREIVNHLGQTLMDLVGANEAMQFVLNEYDRAPFSVKRIPFDGWEAYHSPLASWRPSVTDATLLERFYQIVLKRLTSYLLHGHQQNEAFIKNHQYYWAEKEEGFASTAVAVFQSRQSAPDLASRVAEYLRNGLRRPEKAVAFLQSIRNTNAFNEDNHYKLAATLIEVNEHQQAVVELQQLYNARPQLRYGLRMMGCYAALKQRDQLKHTLAVVEKLCAERSGWSISDLSRVAQTCYETGLYVDAERLYGLLIPKARQSNQRQDELWNHYRYQALNFIELDKTGPALDSISAAIVLWGGTFQQRADVLDSLRTIMRRAKDPQSVITWLDGEAKKNAGRENVVLRRMLAEVLLEQSKPGLAATQLRLVLELKPEDDAASKLLIQAYDTLKQPAEALQAALHRSEYVSRQTDTWRDLGDRLTGLNRAAQAERAYTSLIEVLPNDAESEMALARVREKQSRWNDAIVHWKLGVEYRREDPAGLLGLANAYMQSQQWTEARTTLDALSKPKKPWHRRFVNLELNAKIEEMRKKLPAQ